MFLKQSDITITQKEEIVKILRKLRGIEEKDLKIEAIRHGSMTRNNVWKVHSDDGKKYIIKQFIVLPPEQHIEDKSAEPHYSQFTVESNILGLLKKEGCSVPDVIATDESNQTVALEWCGDLTWDDLCQDENVVDEKRYTRLAIEEFCYIERIFFENVSSVEPYVYPMDYQSYLRQTGAKLLYSARQCISYLAWLRDEPLTDSENRMVDESWNEISHCILNRTPSLGTLDYNARNIIIDQNQLTFIDFSAIGWDWSERRLVQYLTGLGAHIKGGNFVTLLDSEHTKLYAETMSKINSKLNPQELTALVDYHHILFYLTAITRLLGILKNPKERQSILLSQAWGDVEPRLARALSILVHESLSNDEAAMSIRKLLLTFTDRIDTDDT